MHLWTTPGRTSNRSPRRSKSSWRTVAGHVSDERLLFIRCSDGRFPFVCLLGAEERAVPPSWGPQAIVRREAEARCRSVHREHRIGEIGENLLQRKEKNRATQGPFEVWARFSLGNRPSSVAQSLPRARRGLANRGHLFVLVILSPRGLRTQLAQLGHRRSRSFGC